ncbi:MAG TPA: NAD(P)H-hydrate dehydratase [Micromonosporaceae bacterium]|nr:NAD(P)H-hydrate dehydratase [Micromonosporaceae bacterium]
MRGAWRVADVRAAEDALMATLPDGTLMQRAAAGLARRCALLLADAAGGVYGRRVLLLVGAGNNGGDALYAGAALARRGATVDALLLVPDRVHSGGLAAFRGAGGTVVDQLPAADLVVDGIVGIGASGGLREPASRVVDAMRHLRTQDGRRPVVVAVDVPSGVEVDTGYVPGTAVRADATVTFGCLKLALIAGPAAALAGEVEVVDIGLTRWLRGEPAVRVPELSDLRRWWPRLPANAEKYTRGVVGLATGSARYPGAAVLSVAGALTGPVGLIRYAGTAAPLVAQHHPSVIVTDRVANAGRVQAWVCGSGLGTDERAAADLRAILATSVPVVLDADALTLLVDGSMAGLLRHRDAPIVLTPHDREFARLAGGGPGDDRVAAALRLASWTNAVVLLKGDHTIVGTPGGRAWSNPTGTPVLATGGTGDVLAGLLGSLLAAGVTAERAAVAAAYLHGLAGREAAHAGPVTSADVPSALRTVISELDGHEPA